MVGIVPILEGFLGLGNVGRPEPIEWICGSNLFKLKKILDRFHPQAGQRENTFSNVCILSPVRSLEQGGGGHSGTEYLPTDKRPRGAEAVNAKI